jgi:large subunit ribosomal protein L28
LAAPPAQSYREVVAFADSHEVHGKFFLKIVVDGVLPILCAEYTSVSRRPSFEVSFGEDRQSVCDVYHPVNFSIPDWEWLVADFLRHGPIRHGADFCEMTGLLSGERGCPEVAESSQVPVKSRFAPQVLNFLGVVMAQQCDICGKKPQAGNRISHAHNVTKRRWNINLRPVHARVGAATKRMRVCTSCLRSGKVVKA